MARIIDKNLNSNTNQKRGGLGMFCGFCSFILFAVIIIVGITGFSQAQNYSQFASSKTTNTSALEFEVRSGETIRDITKRLIDAGIIEDKNVLFVPTSELFLQLNRIDSSQIQAGNHQIPAQTPIIDVYNYFKLKECEQVKVTFKEGLRVEEFAENLEKSLTGKNDKKFDSAEFIQIARNYKAEENDRLNFRAPANLEGFLYPDTYNFCTDITSKQAIDRLLNTFNDKVYNEIATDLVNQELDIVEVVKKASLVEREAFNNDERKVIAGIIENRLKDGMVLGIDASSQYSTGYSSKEKTWWPKGNEFLTQLQKDEPYNLRKRAGLPPTPIANPSLNSIKAVINPTKTDYYYYLHNDCGGIHYARTLDQHNVNKNRYIGTGRC